MPEETKPKRPSNEELEFKFVEYDVLRMITNIPDHTLRDLRATRVIKPVIQRGPLTLWHVPSVVAQLKKYAGITTKLILICLFLQTGFNPRLPVAVGLSPSTNGEAGAKDRERKGQRAFLEQEVRSLSVVHGEIVVSHCVTVDRRADL